MDLLDVLRKVAPLSPTVDAEFIRVVERLSVPGQDRESDQYRESLAVLRIAFQTGVLYAARRVAECPEGAEVAELDRLSLEMVPFVGKTVALAARFRKPV